MQVQARQPRRSSPRPAEAAAPAETPEQPSGKSMRGNARHKGLPAHLRKAAVIRRLADRVKVTANGDEGKTKGSPEMEGWVSHPVLDSAKSKVKQAIALLTGAASELEGLGADFSPTEKRPRGSRAKKLEKGTKVKLREKAREQNKDFFTAEELASVLTVERHSGSKVLLVLDSKEKLVVPRGLIELVNAPASDDELEEDDDEDLDDDESDEEDDDDEEDPE